MQAEAPSTDRAIDVLFMGGLDDRRGAALAQLAPRLWNVHSDIRAGAGSIGPSIRTPRSLSSGSTSTGCSRRSKLLLNIHRDRSTHRVERRHASAVLRVGSCDRGDGDRLCRDHRAVGRVLALGCGDAFRRSVDRRDGRCDRRPAARSWPSGRDRPNAARDRSRSASSRWSIRSAPLLGRIEENVLPRRRSTRRAPRGRGRALAPGRQQRPAPRSARPVPALSAHIGRRQASRHGRERRAATTRCRGLRVEPRRAAAHRTLRDAGVRGCDARGRRRRHRCTTTPMSSPTHWTASSRAATCSSSSSSSRTTPPTQAARSFSSSSTTTRRADGRCSPRTPTRVWRRLATPASSMPVLRW